jgi:hypothetical protein
LKIFYFIYIFEPWEVLNKPRKHANKHVRGHHKASLFEIRGVSKRTLKTAWVLSRLCYVCCWGVGRGGMGIPLNVSNSWKFSRFKIMKIKMISWMIMNYQCTIINFFLKIIQLKIYINILTLCQLIILGNVKLSEYYEYPLLRLNQSLWVQI